MRKKAAPIMPISHTMKKGIITGIVFPYSMGLNIAFQQEISRSLIPILAFRLKSSGASLVFCQTD
ncbi:conserved hypothetical protein [Vibrio coralliirubri]|nr:conserved hypothetical protein [Vibrio coralliirubri]